MSRHWATVVLCVLSLCGALSAQTVFPPSSYVTIVPGDVPILLTAPHGGTLSYPLSPRTCTGDKVCGRDANTRLIAPAASDAFYALTGHRPYMVIAQGDRKYIDLNRSNAGGTPNDAYDDPDAEPYYDYYHDAVQDFVDEIRTEFGRGLMLDIHGQSTYADTVLRGTKNGLSTTEMYTEFGGAALNGPNSIFGTLDALGYLVDPDVSVPYESQVENENYDGAYSVETYGSNHSTGIDMMQVEFGYDYRGGTAWQATSEDLGLALSNFYYAYLAQDPGDFDRDGDVDLSDLAAWQRGIGQFTGEASVTDGDANGDGLVDGDDLAVWQNNLGTGAGVPSIAAVPEPAALLLVTVAVVPLALRRPRCSGAVLLLLVTAVGVTAASPACAEVVAFTDLASWQAALAGPASLEDFEGAIRNDNRDVEFGLAYQPTTSPLGALGLTANANYSNNALIDVSPYRFSGSAINGSVVINLCYLDNGSSTNSQETVVVTLPDGISAFAFEYNNYDSQGDGTYLSFAGTNGQVVSAFNPVDGFFGVVDTTPGASITQFSFTSDPTTGSGVSVYNSFDDVRYGAAASTSALAVPEPSGIALLAVACILWRRDDRGTQRRFFSHRN